jgi:hypothetical protein
LPTGLDFLPPPHRTVHAVLAHRYTRLALNLWMARRLAELNTGVDVRDRLADARARCLASLPHRTRGSRRDNSRYLAEQIPGTQLLELPGVDDDPWVGATNDILAALEEFVPAIGRDRLEPALPA